MKKLLVIDDEASTRELLKISLESDGYTVFVAEDGPKGLEIFGEENPAIVLTDIKMPGMDGIEVLQKVKEQSPRGGGHCHHWPWGDESGNSGPPARGI